MVLAPVPVIGLSALPLANGFVGKVWIPEFIFDYIKGAPVLLAIFLAVMAGLNVLLFSISSPSPASFWRGAATAARCGRARLLKGGKIKTARALLVCIPSFLLAALLLSACMILLLWLWSKWAAAPDGGRGLFTFHYLKLSAMGGGLLGVLDPVSLLSAVLSLYHHYRGDVRPEPVPAKRSIRSGLPGVLSVAAALILMGIFSETELGGSPHAVPQAGTVVAPHRAGAAFAPENTLAALEWSIREGVGMAGRRSTYSRPVTDGLSFCTTRTSSGWRGSIRRSGRRIMPQCVLWTRGLISPPNSRGIGSPPWTRCWRRPKAKSNR